MLRKLIPVIIALIALGGGIAAGDMLHPGNNDAVPDDVQDPTGHGDAAPDAVGDDTADVSGHQTAPASGHGAATTTTTTTTTNPAAFSFPSQFFVPVVRNGDMGTVMILTLSLQTDAAQIAFLQQQEHLLRDALLRQLLIQANTGGFDGNFTSETSLGALRAALLKSTRAATSVPIEGVLIEAIARQEG